MIKITFFWSLPLVSFKFRYLLLQLEFHSGYKCHCQLQYERPSRVIFSRVWTQGDKFCLCWLKVESPNTNMLLRDLLLLKNIEIKHLWKLKKHTYMSNNTIHSFSIVPILIHYHILLPYIWPQHGAPLITWPVSGLPNGKSTFSWDTSHISWDHVTDHWYTVRRGLFLSSWP